MSQRDYKLVPFRVDDCESPIFEALEVSSRIEFEVLEVSSRIEFSTKLNKKFKKVQKVEKWKSSNCSPRSLLLKVPYSANKIRRIQ